MFKLLLSSLLAAVAARDVILMKPLRDRWALKDDYPLIQLKDYVGGSGKEIRIVKAEGVKELPRIKNVQDIQITGDNCISATRTYEDTVTICGQKIHRVDFMTPDEPEKIFNIDENLKCFDLAFIDLLQGVLVLCQNTNNSDRKIVLFKLDQATMSKEWETTIPEIEVLENMILKYDESLNVPEKAVVIYKKRRNQPLPIAMHAVVITGPSKSGFTYQMIINIKDLDPVSKELDLELLSVELTYPRMYIALQKASAIDDTKNEMVFLNCSYPKLSAFTCRPEVPRQLVSNSTGYTGDLVRDYSGAGGEKIYMMRGRTVHEVDFTDKIVRHAFKMEDSENTNIDFSGKSAIHGGLVYFVHYYEKSLWLFIINVRNNFYNKVKMVDVGELTGDQIPYIRALFDEHVYGGYRPDIFLIAPGLKKVKVFFTYDWSMEFDMSLAKPDPMIKGLNNLDVSIEFTGGKTSKSELFQLKIVDDPKLLNDFLPPTNWDVYKGSGLQTLNLVKEQFKGDSISVTVNKDSNLQPRIEYSEKIEVKLDKDMPIKDGILHNQGKGYTVVHDKTMTFMECEFKDDEKRDQLGYLDCKTLFDYELPGDAKLKSVLMFDGSFKYVLYNNDTKATLVILYPNGEVVDTQAFSYQTELIQIREFNNIIFLEAIIELKGEAVLKYSSTTVGGIPYKNSRTFDQFYGKINPIGLKKSSSKLNSIFIESMLNERLELFEVIYDMENKVQSITQTQFPVSGDVATCYFQEFTTVIEPASNKMYAVSRDADPTAKRVYPLAEYSINSIQKVVCDHEHYLVLVHTNDGIDNRVVVFRVEFSNSEALRRIHSLIELNDRSDDEISSAGGGDHDTAIVIVFNQRESSIYGYKYQVEVPLVTIQIDENPVPDTSSVDFEFRVVGSSTALKRSVNVSAIDQDVKITAEVVSSPPEYLDGTFLIDDFIAVDGIGVQVEWHNHTVVKQDNIKFRQRADKADDQEKLLPNFIQQYDGQFICQGTVYIAWSKGASSEIHIYDTKNSKDIVYTSRSKNLVDCFVSGGSNNLIICTKQIENNTIIQVVLFKKSEQTGEWYQESSFLNYEVSRFESFPLDEDRYAIAMMDKKFEGLSVYVAENGKSFNKNFDRALTITSRYQINKFNTFKVQKKMVVAKHEGMSNKINFFELAFDDRFDAMVITREHVLDMFGGDDNSGFTIPNDLKCYSKELEDITTDVYCVALHRGVYSYASKLKFSRDDDPMNIHGESNDYVPKVIFYNKIKNVQGYISKDLRVYKDWAAVLLEKDPKAKVRAPTLKSTFYLAVYKISAEYTSPYAMIEIDSLHNYTLTSSQIKFNMEYLKPEKKRLLITFYLMGTTSTVRRFSIGSMEATFSKVKNLRTGKNEGLLFKGLTEDKDQSAFIMSRSIYWTYENTNSWKSALNIFLIILVVTLSVFVVIFLVQSIQTFQSIGEEEEILREFDVEDKDHLDEKPDNAI